MNQVKEFLEYIFNAFKIWIIVQPWETGIRVRFGKHQKILSKGIHFRIPYFDSIYIQESRLRVVSMPLQTVTSLDDQTITLNIAIGFSIVNIEKLYGTLYHPETTIRNIAMSEMATYVGENNIKEINKQTIENSILDKLTKMDYGIAFKYCKLNNFAIVKTYRLIQDRTWLSEGVDMEKKK